jgi:DNA-binding TFAR19-related protein (PDSD5 family)
MDEEELEDIKKKRLEARKAQEQLKSTLRVALDEEAYERLMNVALANNDVYLATARQVLMAFKRVGRKINEEELLMVLKAIKEQTETKTSIKFHKK